MSEKDLMNRFMEMAAESHHEMELPGEMDPQVMEEEISKMELEADRLSRLSDEDLFREGQLERERARAQEMYECQSIARQREDYCYPSREEREALLDADAVVLERDNWMAAAGKMMSLLSTKQLLELKDLVNNTLSHEAELPF